MTHQVKHHLRVPAFGLFLVFGLQAAACDEDDSGAEQGSDGHDDVHWDYDENGPAVWGELSEDWRTCSEGQAQSPVDIPAGAATMELADSNFEYLPAPVDIHNNGHTVQFDYGPGSVLLLGARAFELKQFHYHVTSEHTRSGISSPLELHFVHQADDGQLAVVGVFVEGQGANQAFSTFANHAPMASGAEANAPELWIDATELLPAAGAAYHYPGSLTTPPCTEGVLWYVMAHPIKVADVDLQRLTNTFAGNNRPVMPLHGRTFTTG